MNQRKKWCLREPAYLVGLTALGLSMAQPTLGADPAPDLLGCLQQISNADHWYYLPNEAAGSDDPKGSVTQHNFNSKVTWANLDTTGKNAQPATVAFLSASRDGVAGFYAITKDNVSFYSVDNSSIDPGLLPTVKVNVPGYKPFTLEESTATYSPDSTGSASKLFSRAELTSLPDGSVIGAVNYHYVNLGSNGKTVKLTAQKTPLSLKASDLDPQLMQEVEKQVELAQAKLASQDPRNLSKKTIDPELVRQIAVEKKTVAALKKGNLDPEILAGAQLKLSDMEQQLWAAHANQAHDFTALTNLWRPASAACAPVLAAYHSDETAAKAATSALNQLTRGPAGNSAGQEGGGNEKATVEPGTPSAPATSDGPGAKVRMGM